VTGSRAPVWEGRLECSLIMSTSGLCRARRKGSACVWDFSCGRPHNRIRVRGGMHQRIRRSVVHRQRALPSPQSGASRSAMSNGWTCSNACAMSEDWHRRRSSALWWQWHRRADPLRRRLRPSGRAGSRGSSGCLPGADALVEFPSPESMASLGSRPQGGDIQPLTGHDINRGLHPCPHPLSPGCARAAVPIKDEERRVHDPIPGTPRH